VKAELDAKDDRRAMKPGPTFKSNRRRAAITREIRDLCHQITREFNPDKIILFGSHAHGKPQWDSDVDLLVIMPFKEDLQARLPGSAAASRRLSLWTCLFAHQTKYPSAWLWVTSSYLR
jgi:hypothetical protein